MHRRAFLKAFGLGVAATAAAMTLDPEMALWKPGAKKIFLPSAPTVLTDKELGISIRMLKQFDAQTFPSRMDVLYGWATLRPDLAIRGFEA